ncbi:MAG: Carbohydrate binding domain [Bacteroidetes bacterium]|jgi:hypothetical protein|nr:Carbohydrate binding domain [Bacteroidota bacterium]
MKTIQLFIGSLPLFCCSQQMSESAPDTNAGLNGGFEEVRNGLPVNWLVYTPKTTGGDFDFTFNKKDFKEGQQSLQFTVRECSDKGGKFSPGIAQEIPVEAGEEYRISFWIKSKESAFLVHAAGVDAFRSSDTSLLKSSESDGKWQQYEYLYKIPADMKRLRFELSVLSAGRLWVDDVQVSKTK